MPGRPIPSLIESVVGFRTLSGEAKHLPKSMNLLVLKALQDTSPLRKSSYLCLSQRLAVNETLCLGQGQARDHSFRHSGSRGMPARSSASCSASLARSRMNQTCGAAEIHSVSEAMASRRRRTVPTMSPAR